MKRWVLVALLAGALATGLLSVGAALTLSTRPAAPLPAAASAAPPARLVDQERGATVAGTVAPLVSVEVGTALVGQLTAVFADFNQPVAAGDPLARIDPRPFEARVRELEAEHAAARARLALQQAAYDRSRAEVTASTARSSTATAQSEAVRAHLAEAAARLQRLQSLQDGGGVSATELDTARARHSGLLSELRASESNMAAARATIDRERAGLRMSEAQLALAEAQLAQAAEVLAQARLRLEQTTLRAPFDGVVLDRFVVAGQTLTDPADGARLFTIGTDLERVKVILYVDESGVGRIRAGQPVTFTVEAYPERTFRGHVTEIRALPDVTQNVVAFKVIAHADNPQRLLLPGMTAVARIQLTAVNEAGASLGQPAAGSGTKDAGVGSGLGR